MGLTYNNFGQIAELRRGGHQADISYEYDLLQGVLRGISYNCGFVQAMHREDNTQHPLYNGSISSMEWHYPGETMQHKYEYQYDSYNRLTDADYSQTTYSASVNRSSAIGSMMEELPVNRLVPTPELQSATNTSRYGTSYSYDKHGNILSLERRGMMNNRSYGVIDDLTVTYNGNRRMSVSDAAGTLTYDGASDFADGASASTEYTYDNNGSLTKDQNRGITEIQYDLLGNPKKITFSGNRTIEYLYSSEGTRLRAIHNYPQNPNVTTSALHRDTTDYVCGLILKNRHPESYQFDGGYATFTNESYSGWHYYVQDYLGSNRLVVNRNGTVEQKTHYYPYGGMIGDISTNESTQKYKFEGKELDRSFGLDNYDIHARNYFAMLPMWDRVDPLAEKYYGISPYVYCAGDPVNFVDFDGKDIFEVSPSGIPAHGAFSESTILRFKDFHGNILKSVQLSSDNSYDEIMSDIVSRAKNSKNYSWGYGLTSAEKALILQNVMTENTSSEWKAEITKEGKGLIVTNFESNFVDSTPIENKYKIIGSENLIEIHGHPGRNSADGTISEGTRGGSAGDQNRARNKPKTKRVFVNHQATGHIYEFDGSHQSIKEWISFDKWMKDVLK